MKLFVEERRMDYLTKQRTEKMRKTMDNLLNQIVLLVWKPMALAEKKSAVGILRADPNGIQYHLRRSDGFGFYVIHPADVISIKAKGVPRVTGLKLSIGKD